MFPLYDGPLGILMVTAGCLNVGTLFTILASYLRSGSFHPLEWVGLIIPNLYLILHPWDLAEKYTELPPSCLAVRSSWVGSVGSFYLLYFLHNFLREDLIADAKSNSCDKEEFERQKKKAERMFALTNMAFSTGLFGVYNLKGPSCSLSLLRTVLYVAWVLGRMATIKANIAAFRAILPTGPVTPNLSVRGYAIVGIYTCAIAELCLELGIIIFKARGLAVLLVVSSQVGVAAMLLVYNLVTWRQGTAKTVPDEKSDEKLNEKLGENPDGLLQAEKPLQDCNRV